MGICLDIFLSIGAKTSKICPFDEHKLGISREKNFDFQLNGRKLWRFDHDQNFDEKGKKVANEFLLLEDTYLSNGTPTNICQCSDTNLSLSDQITFGN